MEELIKQFKVLFKEDFNLEEILNKKINIEDSESRNRVFIAMKEIYENMMPFNKYIGITVNYLDFDKVIIKIKMKPELVGNYAQKILHGGVISSVIDLTGGMTAQVNALKVRDKKTIGEIYKDFMMMSTVNMRVDYLRPGSGDYFITTGEIIRFGNKIAVTKMELNNNEGKHIATGTGTYLVG